MALVRTLHADDPRLIPLFPQIVTNNFVVSPKSVIWSRIFPTPDSPIWGLLIEAELKKGCPNWSDTFQHIFNELYTFCSSRRAELHLDQLGHIDSYCQRQIHPGRIDLMINDSYRMCCKIHNLSSRKIAITIHSPGTFSLIDHEEDIRSPVRFERWFAERYRECIS